MKKVLALTLGLSVLSGCSYMNDFVEAQESFFRKTLGMSSGDSSLDDLKSRYADVLADIDFDRLNFILDHRLVESQRSDDSFISIIGLSYVYTYRDDDCNLAFQFGDDKKLSFMKYIVPELDNIQYVKVNGKRVNDAKAAFAKTLVEIENRLPVGRCSMLRTYLDTYIEKGGSNLSVMDIQSYLDEMKESGKIKGTPTVISPEQAAEAVKDAMQKMKADNFGQTADTETGAAAPELAAVQSQLDSLRSQHTKNGKVRMCIIETGEPGLISGISRDQMVSFEKESSGEVIEIDTEKLELCH